jgi:hypothetical protein
MTSVFGCEGSRDTDHEILNRLKDSDLLNFALTCKRAYQVFLDEEFWMRRARHLFRGTKSPEEILEYKESSEYIGEETWKDYYMTLAKPLRCEYPCHEAAFQIFEERNDIVHLLELGGAEPVDEHKQGEDWFFTRRYSGVREGLFHGQISSNLWVDREYRNGIILNETFQFDNGERYEYDYDDMKDQNSVTTATYEGNIRVKDIVYHQREKTSYVKRWYRNGSRKSKGSLINGKKEGLWKHWTPDGESEKSFYVGGEKIEPDVERNQMNLRNIGL